MKVRYLAPARLEVQEGKAYYRSKHPALGNDFVREVQATAARIKENPLIHGEIEPGVRCCQTKRFPYGLVYVIDKTEVLVLAVMHLHRKPGYWRNRLK